MIDPDTFASTVDGAAAHGRLFAEEPDRIDYVDLYGYGVPRTGIRLCQATRPNPDGTVTICALPEHNRRVRHEPYPQAMAADEWGVA